MFSSAKRVLATEEIKIGFYGAAGTVTGSCFLVEYGGSRILVDCGLHQGHGAEEANRGPFPFDQRTVDAVVLTHAHIDHSGLLPLLVARGYDGPIHTTAATADLATIMLADAAHIQLTEQEWVNRKARRAGRPEEPPLFSLEDAVQATSLMRPVPYGQTFALPGGALGTFRDAGHILGSATVSLQVSGRVLVFSGDLGSRGTPIIRDPEPLPAADFLVMESTYGSRRHEGKAERRQLLADAINDTARRGGNLIVPAFAVGRTQEFLYVLDELRREGSVPRWPVFVDSPLAVGATEIFLRHSDCYDHETLALLRSGDDPLAFPGLRFSRSTEESRALNDIRGGAIIVSASGMCDSGRIKHHLKHNLWRPESTVLIIGYQAEGTLGRHLVDGASRVHIFGEEIAVRAKVIKLGGFSAHGDQADLIDWFGAIPQAPRRTFLVHGEAEASQVLAALLREAGAPDVTVPRQGDRVVL